MPVLTDIKKRRVMARDQRDIAQYITAEKERRAKTEWRRKHEERCAEVDRQIAMEAPRTINRTGQPEPEGSWHNAIQLGDLTDASETLTADTMRLSFPTERKFFVPHVKLEPIIDDRTGNPLPVPPSQQRAINGVVRSFMVQQHKDFGVRGRFKLAIKEILHHGSVVITVDEERLTKFEKGSRPAHIKAPVPRVHSMWNCFPDSSPVIQGTEIFYKGSMIIMEWIPLQDALERKDWINKDRLQEQNSKKELYEHIEILTYYGDIFLKRQDGNVLFPNRKTVVSGEVFLESTINKTPYSNVIYTGYERDDVRNPYYTSPIVKRAPMGKFATHMANRTMDSVDLKVNPPISYDSLDNSFRGAGPQIYPGASIGSRGGLSVTTLDVGDPAVGLAAMQFAKQAMQEGTTVDATRKGVSPGTEQTATEVLKTEQRAEVREVEFTANVENELILPYLIMQHDLNKRGLESYDFYNDEPHTPDFMTFRRKDLPKEIIFEVTGSRTLLGEQERNNRFAGTVQLASSSQQLSEQTDWQEVSRQLWEDAKQKDPERFLKSSDANAEIRAAVAQAEERFKATVEQIQQQTQQLQQAAQKAEDDRRSEEIKAERTTLQLEQQKLRTRELELQKTTLEEQLKLTKLVERAEDDLNKQREEIRDREVALSVAPAPEPELEQKEAPAQTINVITGNETKTVEIVRDKDGRPTGAVVQPKPQESGSTG